MTQEKYKPLSAKERDQALFELCDSVQDLDRSLRIIFLMLVHIESRQTGEDGDQIARRWVEQKLDLLRRDTMHAVAPDDEDG